MNDAQAVADRLDEQMRADWLKAQVIPAPVSEDSEFLRRVFLHLNGTLPDVSTARRFLADDSPEKRTQQIEECLNEAAYCSNFARIFREVLILSPGDDFFARTVSSGFEAWLIRQLAQETPYNQIVRQMLQGDASRNESSRQVFQGRFDPSQINPSAFYSSRQSVPENMAAATSRLFLGVRIECAQCHDHPFDHWTQDQFWSVAAFFSGQPAKTESGDITFRIKIPNTELTASAAFLDDTPTGWKEGTDSRKTLAEWVTGTTNKRFSQTIVNRLWGHLFGWGLVEPVDDFSDHNLASHPEVLNLLAEEFVQHNYDLKFLIRAITYSQTYQLSSRRTDPSQDAPETFARMRAQGLTASQLQNALTRATAANVAIRQVYFSDGDGVEVLDPSITRLFPASDGSSLERESSILQALLLMNGQLTSSAVNHHQAGVLGATLEAPFLNLDQKIDTLFLATLTRFPTQTERERVNDYLKNSDKTPAAFLMSKFTTQTRDQRLSELFWVLLNSSEFSLNH